MKKTFSFFLALLMILSIVPAGTIVSSAASETIPAGYTPIYDIEDLYSVRYNLSGNYILMADIDMTNDVAEGGDWDCGYGWLPIGSGSSDYFSGIFDGNGHTIKGMRIENSTNEYIGLFGCIDDATVKNLRMENPEITGTKVRYAGAVAAVAYSSTLENIAVDNIDFNCNYYYNSSSYYGGIVGYTTGTCTINSCYTSGTMIIDDATSYTYAGGILGYSSGTTNITNCYNEASISDVNSSYYKSSIGGISCCGTTSKCINTGKISGAYREGALNCYGSISNCYYLQGTASSGQYDTTDSATTAVPLTAAQMKIQAVFGYLDFDNTWFIDTASGLNHPQLQAMPQGIPESISITSLPTNPPALHNDELDVTGMTIEVTYKNGAVGTKSVTADMVSGYDPAILGEQTVTVTYHGKQATFTVSTVARPASSVSISNSSVDINVGKTKTLTATVSPSTATDKSVTWSSSDTSVAEVSTSGVVTAVAKGTATITATTSNGKKATCTVNVKVPATAVTVSPTTKTLCKGKTVSLSATLTPGSSTDAVKWTSSNTNVCTVDANGKVTAVGAGTAVVKATATSGVYKSCTVTVEEHTYTNKCDTTCNVCSAKRTITHTYSNNCDKSCNVCGATRKVGAHKYTNACDTTCNYCNAKRTTKHTYTNKCDTTCNVCKAKRTIKHTYTNKCDTTCNVCKAKRTIKHTYTNSCDTTCNVCKATRTIKHTYTNACDKTCNVCKATRKVGAHKYTNACDTTCNVCNAKRTIKHTYTNKCDTSCNVCNAKRTIKHTYKTVVTKATLSKNGTSSKKCSVCGKVESKTTIKSVKTITLSDTVFAYTGKAITPTVTVKDSAGKTLKKDTDYTVTYASGRKNVGTYKVTIKLKGNYSGSKTLTFTIKPTTKSSADMYTGGTYKIGAKSNTKITYKSSNSSVAKVSASGVITAVKAGTATITVTSNKISQKINVKVSTPSIKITAPESQIEIGEKLSFTVTKKPSSATVKWSVSNSSLASVSSAGVLTAKKVGTVTVTASMTYGGKTYKSTYSVTITADYPDISVFTSHSTGYSSSYAFTITNTGDDTIYILPEGTVYSQGSTANITALYLEEYGISSGASLGGNGRGTLAVILDRELLFYEDQYAHLSFYIEYKGEKFRVDCDNTDAGLNKCYQLTWMKKS